MQLTNWLHCPVCTARGGDIGCVVFTTGEVALGCTSCGLETELEVNPVYRRPHHNGE